MSFIDLRLEKRFSKLTFLTIMTPLGVLVNVPVLYPLKTSENLGFLVLSGGIK